MLRDPGAMGGTFAAMVEENEIRASLSHYERGRIAVIAAQQGAFVNAEEAVNAFFPMASKGKRSKIRSFALIFEELGDMLTLPDLIREKDGLKIAAALREGAEARLREARASMLATRPVGRNAAALKCLTPLGRWRPCAARRPVALASIMPRPVWQDPFRQVGARSIRRHIARGWTV